MTSQWQLQPIFGSYFLVAMVAAVLIAMLFSRPTFSQLKPGQKRTLLVLRAIVIALLALAMLRPSLITTQKKVQTSVLSILFDVSRSMNYRDGTNGDSRWEQQVKILRQAAKATSGFGENFEVEFVPFADAPRPSVSSEEMLQLTGAADGEETDIARAIDETVKRHTGKRFAGVILTSDGAQRSLATSSSPQQSAKRLDRRSTPLYTLVFGESRDRSQSRQLSIENLQDEYSVFVKNEFALRIGVRIQGYVNQPIPVSVMVEDPMGGQLVLGPNQFVATEDSQIVFGEFAFRPEVAGQYRLTARVREPGSKVDSQTMTAFLNVREGGLRVLLLTSNFIHNEQKFIRQSLDQSPDIELQRQLIPVRSSREFDLQTAVELDQYDVFLVSEVDARSVSPDNWQQIERLIGDGKGFMMYGGGQSFGPGGFATTALSDVLPIVMNEFEYQQYSPNVAPRQDRQIPGPIQMVPTTSSPITYLANDDENLKEWKKLKPLRGANKFDQLKDDVTVLATSEKGDPLLVQSGYQLGRVLAFAGDSTHLWRRFGKPEAHRRFWRQAILWLAKRDKQDANSVFLELPQRRYPSGARIPVRTGLTDELGQLVPDAAIRTVLTMPDGNSVEVPTVGFERGRRGVITETTVEGIYKVTSTADLKSGDSKSTSLEFVVTKSDFELSDPAADPGLMDMIAKITARVGGKTIAPEQLPALLEQIKAAPPRDEIETQSSWQLGDTWQDAWAYFLVLVSVLGTEWFLRKKWHLV